MLPNFHFIVLTESKPSYVYSKKGQIGSARCLVINKTNRALNFGRAAGGQTLSGERIAVIPFITRRKFLICFMGNGNEVYLEYS